MANSVWLNSIERDAWVEKNCDRCFQTDRALERTMGKGPGCPHLARAEQNKLPTPWTRRRNAGMGETYRCLEFIGRPPVDRRGKVVEEIEPMFDVERKTKQGDHQ